MNAPLCPLRLDVAPLPAQPLPLELARVKAHLRVEIADEDEWISSATLAAVMWAEGALHRTIIAREHRWTLRDFPRGWPAQEIRLPRGRTVAAARVAYSRGGVTETLTGPSSTPPGTDYQEDLGGDDGGCIMPAPGETWPSTDPDAVAPVAISFFAGWAPADVPQDIVFGLLLHIGEAYAHRGDDDVTVAIAARDAQLSGYALSRWY